MDFGLLFLRLSAGLMMAGHGIGKVSDLLAGKTAFPDPLGLGSTASLAVAAFAEFFCALAVASGFKTRWATVPVVVTMLVAAFVFHLRDPWSAKELPLLYACAFVTLTFTGGGSYSLDAFLKKRR